MKIISKFSDYYDSVQSYGVDKKVIYNRITKHFDDDSLWHKTLIEHKIISEILSNDSWRTWPAFNNNNLGLNLSQQVIVFFCGKIYPCFVWRHEKENYNVTYYFCYTVEDNKNVINQYGSKKQKEKWSSNTKQKYDFINENHIEIPKLFKKVKSLQNYKEITKLHHAFGVPVFVFHKNRTKVVFIKNPKLSQIQFYKVKDVYQTYQEISMFISGVLGGQSPPIVEISDKDRKAMHGFDNWSFKKHPQKQ